MHISTKGIELIKKHEGCSLKSYLCPANKLTIGYGHTANVKEGMTITQIEAEKLLVGDITAFEAGINKLCPVCTQGQFDALVSFAFNVGLLNFSKSSVYKNHVAGLYKQASQSFKLWNRANGEVLQGLIDRRIDEKNRYLET